MEIHQNLAKVWKMFIRERKKKTKSWVLVKRAIFVGFSLPHYHLFSPFSSIVTLKTNNPQSWWKGMATQPLEVAKWGFTPSRSNRMGLEALQSLIIREMSLFDLSSSSLKNPTCKAVFIWPDMELAQHEKTSPWGHM